MSETESTRFTRPKISEPWFGRLRKIAVVLAPGATELDPPNLTEALRILINRCHESMGLGDE